LSASKPGSLLKKAISIRVFADWKEDKTGFVVTGWWLGVARVLTASTSTPLLALIPTGRMIAVMWNRRTGVLSAALWVMNGILPKPPLSVWTRCMIWYVYNINFFQPTTKLVSRTRHGAKVYKAC